MSRFARWSTVWTLLLIVLLGGLLRFYRLGEKSLWSDEIATIATSLGNSIDPQAYSLRGQHFDPPAPVAAQVYRAKATRSHGDGNWRQTVAVLKANVHPPLFFMGMNPWIHRFGLAPGTLRIPAACLGVCSIFLLFLLGRRLAAWGQPDWSFGWRNGFAGLAALLMALSAYQVNHAQDARQYTLLVAVAILSAWLALGLLQRARGGIWSWLALAGLLAVGLYTQYFFALYAVFIVLLLWGFGKSSSDLRWGLLACVLLTGFFLLPWAPIFQRQLVFLKLAGHYTAGLWNPLQLPEKLWRIVCEFFLPKSSLGKGLPALILGAALGSWLWVWWGQWRQSVYGTQGFWPFLWQRLRGGSPVVGLLGLWLLVLIGGQIGLDLLKGSHTATIRRYLLLASPACYLLMAYALVGLARRSGLWRFLSAALGLTLVTLMLLDTLNYLGPGHMASDEFKQAAAYIQRNGSPQDLVLVSKSGAMAVGMAYYLPPSTAMLGVDVPSAQTLAPESPTLGHLSLQISRQPVREGVWLVFSHAAPSTRNRLASWLEGQGYVSVLEYKVPGVRLTRWVKAKS